VHTFREDDCVVVEIGDNGPGIPPEVEPHIFEPFFTTKAVGEGTGLGLDTVQRIVRKHRGSIQVESAPGNTRFLVRLPMAGSPN
jgi:signal transduction histidine kinase